MVKCRVNVEEAVLAAGNEGPRVFHLDVLYCCVAPDGVQVLVEESELLDVVRAESSQDLDLIGTHGCLF